MLHVICGRYYQTRGTFKVLQLRPVQGFNISSEPIPVKRQNHVLHHTPPRLPRQLTLPVSVEKKNVETKVRDEDVRSVAWASIGHFTLRRFPFYFSLFGNDSDANCLVLLRGFKLCSDWLCVVRNRKWVAMTNTMMTQRLFRNVFFFHFLFVYLLLFFFFLINHIALTHRSTSGRCVTVDVSDF